MSKKLSNLMKPIKQKVQEVQQNQSTRKMNKTTLMHYIIKLVQTSDKKIFKAIKKERKKKDIMYIER